MTKNATKFTPEVLLSAPRRSPGVPNEDASFVLYTTSTYSFSDHKRRTEVRVLDTSSGGTFMITDEEGITEPQWLEGRTMVALRGGEKGTTEVIVGSLEEGSKHFQIAGAIPGPAENLKVRSVGEGKFIIAVSAKAATDGELFNPENVQKPYSTGRLYRSLFVRHWDKYIEPQKNSIFYGTLEQTGDGYKLSKLTNALKGTKLECPIPPFGGGDHFDISSSGIIIVAKDPDLDPALNTKCNAYVIPLSSFTEPPVKVHQVPLTNLEGACTSPVFSPDGTQAAFLTMRRNGYEADKNQLILVTDIRNPSWYVHMLASKDGNGRWDRSPSSISWTHDELGKYLLLNAEDNGRSRIFLCPMNFYDQENLPVPLTDHGTVTDIRICKDGSIFFTNTSLTENSAYYTMKKVPGPAGPTFEQPRLLSANLKFGASVGLSRQQVKEIRFPGAYPGQDLHAWVVVPSTFNYKEKYPLAYLIHGGPQAAWVDGWSTRWNPAVFAEAGYVVICPNPTGSTSYGQAFTDAIRNSWGGLPYQDLVKGFDWIEANLPWVDTGNAVALGGSYGGYMINWIQGHDFAHKFKALVCHDGVFSSHGQLASEELYFPIHDLGGSFTTNRESWLKWDPSAHAAKWSTPELVIHSELDYRLTIGEGLSMFNVLQERGVKSAFLTFPDENHWVLKPENSLVWHKVVLEWINGFVFPQQLEGMDVLDRIEKVMEEMPLADPREAEEKREDSQKVASGSEPRID